MANTVAKNESADNQAVSAPSIDIYRYIKNKKDNIYKKTPSSTTKKKKKKEEEKEEFFYEKKNKRKVTPAIDSPRGRDSRRLCGGIPYS